MIKVKFKILVPPGKGGDRRMGSGWDRGTQDALTDICNILFLRKKHLKQKGQNVQI